MAKIDKLGGQIAEHLDDGEEVIATVLGIYATKVMGKDSVRTGIFAATSRRLVFYAKKLGGYDLESFPYENISSFEMSKGMMGRKMSFFASGNKVEMKNINKGEIDEFTATVRGRMGKGPQAPVAEIDIADQIKRLSLLRDEGVLTEEEFAAKKGELLARM
jgi:hypothetical protein